MVDINFGRFDTMQCDTLTGLAYQTDGQIDRR